MMKTTGIRKAKISLKRIRFQRGIGFFLVFFVKIDTSDADLVLMDTFYQSFTQISTLNMKTVSPINIFIRQNQGGIAFALHNMLQSNIMMILGSKGLSPHELAHKWVKDIG